MRYRGDRSGLRHNQSPSSPGLIFVMTSTLFLYGVGAGEALERLAGFCPSSARCQEAGSVELNFLLTSALQFGHHRFGLAACISSESFSHMTRYARSPLPSPHSKLVHHQPRPSDNHQPIYSPRRHSTDPQDAGISPSHPKSEFCSLSSCKQANSNAGASSLLIDPWVS